MINAAQSYVKYAISNISDDLIITQDNGLTKTLEKHGLDVIIDR